MHKAHKSSVKGSSPVFYWLCCGWMDGWGVIPQYLSDKTLSSFCIFLTHGNMFPFLTQPFPCCPPACPRLWLPFASDFMRLLRVHFEASVFSNRHSVIWGMGYVWKQWIAIGLNQGREVFETESYIYHMSKYQMYQNTWFTGIKTLVPDIAAFPVVSGISWTRCNFRICG